MGTFIGHAIPGTFIILFALWWMSNMYWRYFNARRRNTKFISTATFSCHCCCGRVKEWPMEAYVKILFTLIVCCVEFYVAVFMFDINGYENNAQHATSSLMFCLTGVVDILHHYQAPIPPNMDYISMALATASEGILFKFHTHGRKDLDILLHTLLVYALVANTAAVLIEMKHRHSITAALSRPYFTLLQGTWFWQTGWILYPPFPWSFQWDQEDHGQMMVATIIFIWHLAIDFLIMLCIGGLVCFIQKRYYPSLSGDSAAMKRLLISRSNGETGYSLATDESDIEFEKSVVQ